jgi:hypothetical protein
MDNNIFTTNKMNTKIVKLIISILIANLVRLFRFIPNNDPIMAMMLPYSKQKSKLKAFIFPFVTMVTFDILTNSVGVWTIVTSLTYGGLGLMFTYIYKKLQENDTKIGLKVYLGSGVVGVLIFDFITGVIMAPLMFGMSFEIALLGQIPFTLLHLTTVSGYVIIITPLLDRHIVLNPKLEDASILNYLKIKTGFVV